MCLIGLRLSQLTSSTWFCCHDKIPSCFPHVEFLMALRIALEAAKKASARAMKASEVALKDSYVWIDMEMTGLEVEKDSILEAACIITKPNLTPLHEGLRLVIHQPEEVLQSMNDWAKVHHAKTGLTFESRDSKLSLQEADLKLSEYVKHHASGEGQRFIAGNTVYMDKLFLEKYMPLTNNLLHYRILDVSSLKLLCSHWYPAEFSRMKPKKLVHRALDDILESIEELKNYRKIMFKDEK